MSRLLRKRHLSSPELWFGWTEASDLLNIIVNYPSPSGKPSFGQSTWGRWNSLHMAMYIFLQCSQLRLTAAGKNVSVVLFTGTPCLVDPFEKRKFLKSFALDPRSRPWRERVLRSEATIPQERNHLCSDRVHISNVTKV